VRKAQPSTQARPAQKVQAKPAGKPQTKAKAATKAAVIRRERAASRRSLVSSLFVIFLAFCALSLLISRYAALCSIGVQNNAIKEDIALLEGEIDKLQLDMELRDSVEYIQDTAQNDLKMAYPTQDQKITINMSG
jgi:cell division protein FtsL